MKPRIKWWHSAFCLYDYSSQGCCKANSMTEAEVLLELSIKNAGSARNRFTILVYIHGAFIQMASLHASNHLPNSNSWPMVSVKQYCMASTAARVIADLSCTSLRSFRRGATWGSWSFKKSTHLPQSGTTHSPGEQRQTCRAVNRSLASSPPQKMADFYKSV